jgi:hypothetical protein
LSHGPLTLNIKPSLIKAEVATSLQLLTRIAMFSQSHVFLPDFNLAELSLLESRAPCNCYRPCFDLLLTSLLLLQLINCKDCSKFYGSKGGTGGHVERLRLQTVNHDHPKKMRRSQSIIVHYRNSGYLFFIQHCLLLYRELYSWPNCNVSTIYSMHSVSSLNSIYYIATRS